MNDEDREDYYDRMSPHVDFKEVLFNIGAIILVLLGLAVISYFSNPYELHNFGPSSSSDRSMTMPNP